MPESNEVMKSVTGFKDSYSKNAKVVDHSQVEIYAHNTWTLSKYSTSITSNTYVQMNTGSTNYVHLKLYTANAYDGLYRFVLLEATTASTFTAGTQTSTVDVYNRNRVNSSNYVSECSIFGNPQSVSLTLNNRILDSFIIGSSLANNSFGMIGNNNPVMEFVLNRNTTYIFGLINLAGTTGKGSINVTWTEESFSV